jgi:hypothetical protein
MSNLTSYQQGLIDDLKKEFTKINPKQSINVVKRFSFDTISECQKEEERFLATIRKHNDTMIKVFDKQFKDELKAFEKEFGKSFTTQIGFYYSPTNSQHTHELFITQNKKGVQNDYNHYEMYLFIKSKTKAFNGDSRYNYCNGRDYTKLQVDFKREKVSIKLESGKQVSAYKIVGLIFCSNEYLYRDRECTLTSTLDEFVQTDKRLQTKMVEMAS